CGPTIFIDHKGHLKRRFPKVGNQCIEVYRLGHTHHVTGNCCCRELTTFFFRNRNGLLAMYDPTYFVSVALCYREARETSRTRMRENCIEILICFNRLHVHTRRHHICSGTSRKIQRPIHESCCPAIKGSHLGRSAHQRRQLFWRPS